MFNRMRTFIGKLNFYENDDELSLTDQLLSTRLFMFLWLCSVIFMFTFTAFTPRTYSTTVHSPPDTVVEQLTTQYPSTLTCSCTRTFIRHDEFLSFDLRYHPICHSPWIDDSFIASLAPPNISVYYRLDYRLIVVSHFHGLALFCRTLARTVADAIDEFTSERLHSTEVLSRATFDAQFNHRVQQLKTSITSNMKHTSEFLELSTFQNGIYSALFTNYGLKRPAGTGAVHGVVFRYTFEKEACKCHQSITCVQKTVLCEVVHNSTTNDQCPRFVGVPGLMAGCLAHSSLLHSTLQCFFDQSCLGLLSRYIGGFASMVPLTMSRFPLTTKVRDLFDELFIESWREHRNFSEYFRACAPHSCTYLFDRRFNLVYILVQLISIIGGLTTLLAFVSPVLIKVFRRIQQWCRRTADDVIEPTIEHIEWKQRLMVFVKQMKTKLCTLNLFPTLSDETDGIRSTRVYLVSSTIGLIILIFYTSIAVRTRVVLIVDPSLSTFERLYSSHRSTLVCPCTRLSISHSSIISIEPRYHQVCSSDFIRSDRWLLYFTHLNSILPVLDFRLTGLSLFTILQTLCRMANGTVRNQLGVFDEMQFVSAHALSHDTFEKKTTILIERFQHETSNSFLHIVESVRTSVQLNQFLTFSFSNAQVAKFKESISRTYGFPVSNSFDERCSCGKRTTCTRPQRISHLNATHLNRTVPGLLLSCLPVDSLLASSLHCFYNRSCIDLLLEWRSDGLTNTSLDARLVNIVPLDPRRVSRYPPTTLLETIATQLFIEEWTHETNFSLFYDHCAPQQCIYTYEERFDRAFIIGTILSIVGGPCVTLKILVPLLVVACQRMSRYCVCVTGEMNASTGLRFRLLIITSLRRSIETFNVYSTTSPNMSVDTRRQRIASRFYALLFLCSLLIIIMLLVNTSQVTSTVVSFPSPTTFGSLHSRYASTLSCPCSQMTIRYSHFITVQPSAYHQICTSSFMSSDFIDRLWGSDSSSAFGANLIDRKIFSTQMRLLSVLCALIRKYLDEKIAMFATRELISPETFTSQSIQSQVESLVNGFILESRASFRRTHHYINGMLHVDQLYNILYTNWQLFPPPQDQLEFDIRANPIIFNDTDRSCSCHVSSTCQRPLRWKEHRSPGLVTGCLPVFGLRMSTLECFYSSRCLRNLSTLLDVSPRPSPLNLSVDTRFVPISSTPVGELIDELFIESWHNTSNYSGYFSACAPSTCRYTYAHRNGLLNTVSTFLGLYGGLTVGLKFLVWHALSFYWKLRQYFCHRAHRITPTDSSTSG